MITGYVSNDVALISLVVHGSQGNSLAIEAVIDTGFNDCLILSRDLIDALSLQLLEQGGYVWADGSSIPARFFAADVIWMGLRREVPVLEMESDPLVGMALLKGSKLSIDVQDRGLVMVTPFADNP